MVSVWFYTIASVFVVSLISLIGVFTLAIDQKRLQKFLLYFVSLSAGTLLGDAFIHLLPEAYKNSDSEVTTALYILIGIIAFFILEKFIHWRHCHEIPCESHKHPFSYIILVGDAVHNFIDGMIIAASFSANISIGIATTVAVIFHEIPHEMGNFGSLLYAGFSRSRAIFFNFLSALTAILGAILVLIINFDAIQITKFLVPFAAGGFIYIASADLIPEIHKNVEVKKSILQLFFFIVGIGIMLSLLLAE
ncbi:MAG TPA: ZIP family metal transporter [Patescibacteria group bacterium]